MSWSVIFVIAMKALRRNAMRTSLTALGIIIGVAAVIVMVAIGAGAQASIESQIRGAGSNIVTVSAGSGGFGPVRQGQGAVTTLRADDAVAVRREASGTCHQASTRARSSSRRHPTGTRRFKAQVRSCRQFGPGPWSSAPSSRNRT